MRRHGKYLLLDTAGRDELLLVHLGMTGRLRLIPAAAPRAPHTHVVLALAGRASCASPIRAASVRSTCVRRARERAHPALAVLGPDPLEHGGRPARCSTRPRAGKQATLKAFLLDQSVLAGVGNIYATEALWRRGCRPTLRAHSSTARGADALARGDRRGARATRSTTAARAFATSSTPTGREGENADYLWVYGRAGRACARRAATA